MGGGGVMGGGVVVGWCGGVLGRGGGRRQSPSSQCPVHCRALSVECVLSHVCDQPGRE